MELGINHFETAQVSVADEEAPLAFLSLSAFASNPALIYRLFQNVPYKYYLCSAMLLFSGNQLGLGTRSLPSLLRYALRCHTAQCNSCSMWATRHLGESAEAALLKLSTLVCAAGDRAAVARPKRDRCF